MLNVLLDTINNKVDVKSGIKGSWLTKPLFAGAEGRDQRRGRGGARGHPETEHESAGPGCGEDGDLGVAPS